MDVASPDAKKDISEYHNVIAEYAAPDIVCVVCGANTQRSKARAYSKEELEKEAGSRGLRYFEVDELLQSGGVEEMFRELACSILRIRNIGPNENT